MALHTFKVDEQYDHQRLDVFLTKSLPEKPSRTFVQKLIEFGCVNVNELTVKAHHKLLIGDDVHVDIPDDFLKPKHIKPEAIELNIVYEDDCLMVINKPIGMMVHPSSNKHSGTLVNALMHYSSRLSKVNSEMRPGIVHRLDKETSGLILVAKDNITHTKLAKQFQRHTIRKKYVALAEGLIEFDEGLIDSPIGSHSKHHEKKAVQFNESAKESTTFYKVIKRDSKITYVALFPKTGRTHQLRVHLAHLGHPILGDDKYGKKSTFPRLALHAQSIGFIHPRTKKSLEISIKPPKEFLKKANL